MNPEIQLTNPEIQLTNPEIQLTNPEIQNSSREYKKLDAVELRWALPTEYTPEPTIFTLRKNPVTVSLQVEKIRFFLARFRFNCYLCTEKCKKSQQR